MKEKDLKNVLQQHNIWLESGRKKGERADLSGLGRGLSFVNLSGANLTHAELRDAYLAHFKLRGANLDDTNLNGDNLTCAILDDDKKASDYTFDELQEMSSSQYSEYSYKWMDENTND